MHTNRKRAKISLDELQKRGPEITAHLEESKQMKDDLRTSKEAILRARAFVKNIPKNEPPRKTRGIQKALDITVKKLYGHMDKACDEYIPKVQKKRG